MFKVRYLLNNVNLIEYYCSSFRKPVDYFSTLLISWRLKTRRSFQQISVVKMYVLIT